MFDGVAAHQGVTGRGDVSVAEIMGGGRDHRAQVFGDEFIQKERIDPDPRTGASADQLDKELALPAADFNDLLSRKPVAVHPILRQRLRERAEVRRGGLTGFVLRAGKRQGLIECPAI